MSRVVNNYVTLLCCSNSRSEIVDPVENFGRSSANNMQSMKYYNVSTNTIAQVLPNRVGPLVLIFFHFLFYFYFNILIYYVYIYIPTPHANRGSEGTECEQQIHTHTHILTTVRESIILQYIYIGSVIVYCTCVHVYNIHHNGGQTLKNKFKPVTRTVDREEGPASTRGKGPVWRRGGYKLNKAPAASSYHVHPTHRHTYII